MIEAITCPRYLGERLEREGLAGLTRGGLDFAGGGPALRAVREPFLRLESPSCSRRSSVEFSTGTGGWSKRWRGV